MTTYPSPDYDVIIELTPATFLSISGASYSVFLTFTNDGHRVKGMLMIPGAQEVPESDPTKTAWLWAKSHDYASVGEKVKIKIDKPVEPMLTEDEIRRLETYHGTSLAGVITNNWNT